LNQTKNALKQTNTTILSNSNINFYRIYIL
jgi:hypothetical protein